MADTRNTPSTEGVSQAILACAGRHIAPGDTVAVAFSGGLDSSVLLHAAHTRMIEIGVPISAIHVHHGLSQNSDDWAEFCTSTCNAIGIELTVAKIQVPQKPALGIEGEARLRRLTVFDSHPANWVLLGHHADDQAETLMHNLLRGSGVRGASGMPAARGRYLRPFLGLQRADLLAYAKRCGLRWIEDESNCDTRFTRNYLRTNVLPRVAQRFPKAAEQLSAAAARFAEANQLLDELARLDLGCRPATFPVPANLLKDLSEARARNLLRALLNWQHVQSPDDRRLNEFLRQIRSSRPDRHPRLELPGYALWYERGAIRFQSRDQVAG